MRMMLWTVSGDLKIRYYPQDKALFLIPGILVSRVRCVPRRCPPDKVEKFVNVVNSYRGVTHNYLRDHEYNVWFTFIAPAKNEIEKSLSDISRETGIIGIINMPVKRRFKVDARFKL